MRCPEAAFRDSLSDAEFWTWVFYGTLEPPEYEPDEYDYPELWVAQCARCGAGIYCEEYEQVAELLDQRAAFCDDCVDDQLPDLDDDTHGRCEIFIGWTPAV